MDVGWDAVAVVLTVLGALVWVGLIGVTVYIYRTRRWP